MGLEGGTWFHETGSCYCLVGRNKLHPTNYVHATPFYALPVYKSNRLGMEKCSSCPPFWSRTPFEAANATAGTDGGTQRDSDGDGGSGVGGGRRSDG